MLNTKSWMSNVQKIPLNLDLYDKYGIDQQYSAFKVIITDISMEQVDQLEYDYIAQGYKLFNSELERYPNKNSFILTLIIAKLSYTF